MPIRDDSGRLVKFVGSTTDIHEDRIREQRLIEFQKQLEEAIEARDNFLSIASHELRTPLSSLRLQIEVTCRRIQKLGPGALTPDHLAGFVQQIRSQSERLTKLVDDMLDVSRISLGKLTISREPCDLGEITRAAASFMTPQLEQAGCELVLGPIESINGHWDHFRIEQIIINLLSNAAKYGERKPVHVSLGRENGRAVLRVVDHGLGIAPEHQKRIFEQFERAVPSRKISGLGLGLFIASQIAEGHGGTIRVESAPGQGSTFTVELPVWALLG